jgi:hypothetical protein
MLSTNHTVFDNIQSFQQLFPNTGRGFQDHLLFQPEIFKR